MWELRATATFWLLQLFERDDCAALCFFRQPGCFARYFGADKHDSDIYKIDEVLA